MSGQYLSSLRLVALTVCLIGTIVSATAEPFTHSIFGADWEPMIGTLAVLGLWAALKPVQSTVGWLLNSTGYAGTMAILAALLLLPGVPLLILAANIGVTAVAWVVLGQTALSFVLLVVLASRKLGVSPSDHARVLLPIASAGGVAWAATWAIVDVTSGLAPLASLLASALCGTAVYLTAITVLTPDTPRYVARQVGRALGFDKSPTDA